MGSWSISGKMDISVARIYAGNECSRCCGSCSPNPLNMNSKVPCFHEVLVIGHLRMSVSVGRLHLKKSGGEK